MLGCMGAAASSFGESFTALKNDSQNILALIDPLPNSSAPQWEPRNYLVLMMVRPERFELPTYCSGGNRSIHLSYGRTTRQLYDGGPAKTGLPGHRRVSKSKLLLANHQPSASAGGLTRLTDLFTKMLASCA